MENYSEDEEGGVQQEVRLTKHLGLVKEFPPLYTGGSFALLKNDRVCLALRDSKICVFDIETSKQITVIA